MLLYSSSPVDSLSSQAVIKVNPCGLIDHDFSSSPLRLFESGRVSWIASSSIGSTGAWLQSPGVRELLLLKRLPDHPERTHFLLSVGDHLLSHYFATGAVSSLEESVLFGREAIALTPPEHPKRPEVSHTVSVYLDELFTQTGITEYLEEAIQIGQEAVKTSQSCLDRGLFLRNIAIFLSHRYSVLSELSDLHQAIEAAKESLHLVEKGNPERGGYLSTLGTCLYDTFSTTGNIAALEEAIHVGEKAMDITPSFYDEWPGLLSDLGIYLTSRYTISGNESDLTTAIQLSEKAIKKTSENDSHTPGFLHELSSQLGKRYWLTGRKAELERAIRLGLEAIQTTPENHPRQVQRLLSLGNLFYYVFERTWELADIEESIRLGQKALYLAPQSYPGRAEVLEGLSMSFVAKHQRLRTTAAEMEEAVRLAREPVNIRPHNHPDRPRAVSNLGYVLGEQYGITGLISTLQEAIQFGREALLATSSSHTARADRLSTLAENLKCLHTRIGDINQLEEAISLVREALQITRESHRDRLRLLNYLGELLGTRYKSGASRVADLEEAILLGSEAVETTPKDDSRRVGFLQGLGNHLYHRSLRNGSLSDLQKSIQLMREALHAALQDDLSRPMLLRDLSTQFRELYSLNGVLSHLTEAILLSTEALETYQRDYPNHPIFLDHFATLLGDRFVGTGAMADIDECIQLKREAIRITPPNHPVLAEFFDGLGVALSDRYSRTAISSDLEEAVEYGWRAVNATPQDNIAKAWYLHNLASHLSERYLRAQDPDPSDIKEAIRMGREAVGNTPRDSPDRIGRLNNLAAYLNARFSTERALVDLEDAIRFGREAIDIAPEGYLDRAILFNNLGNHLCDRFAVTNAEADLDEAIEAGMEATRIIPPDHPDGTIVLTSLGDNLVERERTTRNKNPGNLDKAIIYYQSAVRHHSSPPIIRIQAASKVLQIYGKVLQGPYLNDQLDFSRLSDRNMETGASAVHSHWEHAYEVASIAVDLIPRLTLRHHENTDKQYILSYVAGFASEAAATAFHARKGPLAALNILEQARGVLAASLEELRIDVLDLQDTHPTLAERFNSLRNQMKPPVRDRAVLGAQRRPTSQAESNRQKEIVNEFDQVLIEIRKEPGFESFLLSPREDELKNAARCGPIVVINVSTSRCDAILIQSHQIRYMHLSKLKRSDIESKVLENTLGSPDVLEWLWDNTLEPILDTLGFTNTPSNKKHWPRVWWIPTGSLSKFPLQAAGYHSHASSAAVLDRVMSSYSSSLKAIVYGRQRRLGLSLTSTKAVLVAMECTPGKYDLRSAQNEVAAVRDLCQSMGLTPVEPKQYKKDVLADLLECSVFHFAGHGSTNHSDPSQSHLLLRDGEKDPLSVANLLEINLRKHSPFLAYLSACGTGQIRKDIYFDESIHLISGFQLAGFRHVIGTLWEVNDKLCEDMAKLTYEEMKKGEMTDESVCQGLHIATRNLRERWLKLKDNEEQERGTSAFMTLPAEDKSDACSTSSGDKEPDRSSRNAFLCNEDKRVQSLQWVPYVHFGI